MWPLLAGYCLLILVASLLGGWLPLLMRLTHRRLELAVSFVAGVMLGVGLLHLLPHAWLERAAGLELEQGAAVIGHEVIDPVLGWMLGGFLVMFFVERFFRFHHHDAPEPTGRDDPGQRHPHRLTWTGAAVGLTLHSVMAGVALGASVAAESAATEGAGALAGLGTFLVIFLHKPFDSLTLGTLMAAGGWPVRLRHLVNVLFALGVPAGVALLFLGLGDGPASRHYLISVALAVSAGMFLCISLSDLLPELHFHQHDRSKLSLALVLGLAVAWGIRELESHAHEPDRRPAEVARALP